MLLIVAERAQFKIEGVLTLIDSDSCLGTRTILSITLCVNCQCSLEEFFLKNQELTKIGLWEQHASQKMQK